MESKVIAARERLKRQEPVGKAQTGQPISDVLSNIVDQLASVIAADQTSKMQTQKNAMVQTASNVVSDDTRHQTGKSGPEDRPEDKNSKKPP